MYDSHTAFFSDLRVSNDNLMMYGKVMIDEEVNVKVSCFCDKSSVT